MSKSPAAVPDAWEDDWENQAGKSADLPELAPPAAEKKVSSKVTKAQKRAAQVEFNRQLWAEAETPQTFHFLESKSAVPLKQDFKPAVTVLSRRPQIASRSAGGLPGPSEAGGIESAAAGMSRLSLNNADGAELSDSDDEESRPPQMTAEERHAKALKDREQKQRKYEEVRERLFGSSSNPGSGTSSPGGSTTPPPSRNQSSGGGGGGDGSRGRGRNRGGNSAREKRDSPGNGSKSSATSKPKQLYDPVYSAKPNSTYLQQRKDRPSQQQLSTEQCDGGEQFNNVRQPTRSPRGPDGSGRGGFGFSPRGRGA